MTEVLASHVSGTGAVLMVRTYRRRNDITITRMDFHLNGDQGGNSMMSCQQISSNGLGGPI